MLGVVLLIFCSCGNDTDNEYLNKVKDNIIKLPHIKYDTLCINRDTLFIKYKDSITFTQPYVEYEICNYLVFSGYNFNDASLKYVRIENIYPLREHYPSDSHVFKIDKLTGYNRYKIPVYKEIVKQFLYDRDSRDKLVILPLLNYFLESNDDYNNIFDVLWGYILEVRNGKSGKATKTIKYIRQEILKLPNNKYLVLHKFEFITEFCKENANKDVIISWKPDEVEQKVEFVRE